MTKDEARTLLVEQGALVLAAQRRAYEAKVALTESMQPILEAEARGFGELLIDVEQQEQCFRESCVLAGEDPQHPAFASTRAAFADKRHGHHEERLNKQLQNADWN